MTAWGRPRREREDALKGTGPRRVALVVGSGGLKCAAAIGLWKVLARENIEVDLLVGCSGGSVYTATIAMGMNAEQMRETNGLWRAGLFRRKRWRSLLQAVAPSIFGFDERFGLIDDTALNRVFDEIYGETRFDELQIPLHIVATDLHSSEKVTLSSGLVRDAIRASVAVPFLLPPWEVDGRALFDGGASDPLPIDVAIREGAEIIIALGFENPLVTEIPSAVRLALQTSAITVNHLLKSTFAFYNLAHHAEVIPIMPSFDRPIGLTDVHLAPYIIEQGEIAAEREIPYLKKLLTAPETTSGWIA
jgi:NTE family protein